ncbi:armadillo-type protein [Blakeslea trispora]|nr:armadillo-type protein [Blakeslea trispora]
MALDILQKISEDNASDLVKVYADEKPMLDVIIPHLIYYINLSQGSLKCCVMAISIISHYVKYKPTSLSSNIDLYIHSLLQVGIDQDIQLRQEVCRSFVMILDHFTSKTLPHLPHLVDYMIACNQSENSKVALEACDFWHLFARLQKSHVYLTPYLPRIIPIILKSLIYSEEDLAMFGGIEEDNDPNPLDLPTRFGHRFGAHHARYVYYDDEDDEDDDLEDEEFYSEWTLRKFSATALEALALAFNPQVTDILLPLLDHAWSTNDWKVVESGILALGAAAEGGLKHIEQHLFKLMPFLIESMSNQSAHVRYIACWTTSRFSSWIVAQNCTQVDRTRFYEPFLRALLRRILDKSRRVQEAACSALSTLEEHASVRELDPYLPTILNHLARALKLYRNRNLRLLYDTIGTLAESVGSSLSKPACAAALISPLISKWNSLQNTDLDLFPLLNCLTDIATSVGHEFLPFTEPVFTRCVQLISITLQHIVKTNDGEDSSSINDEFIVAPLDLLSGIVQGLGDLVEPFVKKSALLPLLTVCAHYNTRYEVLQPTYALIGDLAKACFSTLEPYIEKIMPELIRQLENEDSAYTSARNNAIWAIGEIALRWQQESMEKYIDPILRVLISLIQTRPYADLNENVVITLGRIGVHHAATTAHTLPLFAHTWLYLSRYIEEDSEKNSAFHGFCLMIKYFPQSLNDASIRVMLNLIGEWQNPSDTLQALFSQIVSEYHGLLNPEQWKLVSAGLPNPHLIQLIQ